VSPYNTTMPLHRYIFNTLTVVSVLLLLATAGLWVRGNVEFMDQSRVVSTRVERAGSMPVARFFDALKPSPLRLDFNPPPEIDTTRL